MKQRCYNPNSPAYKNYGARGIKLCTEWESDFKSFARWAKAVGYLDSLTIDRVNVNGNYEPDNCRWATWEEQNRNRRDNIRYEFNGERLTLGEISEITGASPSKMWERISRSKTITENTFVNNNLVKIAVVRDDGAIFESCTEAARASGLKSMSSIYNVCMGLSKTARGHSYKYLGREGRVV